MLPFVEIFGRSIPMYYLMTLAGVAVAMLWIKLTEKKRDIEPADVELTLIFAFVGVLVGAKLLYIATVFEQFRSELGYLFTDTGLFLQVYVQAGFVFYGGALGGILGGFLYCRAAKVDIPEMARWCLPILPVIGGFGRIGCFFEGCCYGKASEAFGLIFKNSMIAPADIPLFPIQMVEAGIEFMLFIVMCRMALRGYSGGRIASVWLITYGTARFIIEFFRGDAYRGFIGPFSTSQLISIFIVLSGATVLYLSLKAGGPAGICSGREKDV